MFHHKVTMGPKYVSNRLSFWLIINRLFKIIFSYCVWFPLILWALWLICSSTLFNLFVPNAPFLYPLKTSEKRTVCWCFQGVEKGCIGDEWVNSSLPLSSAEVWPHYYANGAKLACIYLFLFFFKETRHVSVTCTIRIMLYLCLIIMHGFAISISVLILPIFWKLSLKNGNISS